jgi:hypothetical protein
MDMLRCKEIFQFCAIPQAMAIATLAELYNNPDVFTGVVKIRKGLAARMILDCDTMAGLHKWFSLMAKDIRKNIPVTDPSAAKTKAICDKIIELTEEKEVVSVTYNYAYAVSCVAPVGVGYALANLLGPQVYEGRFFSVPDLQDGRVMYGAQALLFTGFALIASFFFYVGRETLPTAEEVLKTEKQTLAAAAARSS